MAETRTRRRQWGINKNGREFLIWQGGLKSLKNKNINIFYNVNIIIITINDYKNKFIMFYLLLLRYFTGTTFLRNSCRLARNVYFNKLA